VYYIKALSNGPIQKSRESLPREDSFFFDDAEEAKIEEGGKLTRHQEYLLRKKKAFDPEARDKIVVTILDTGTGISQKD
jgi:hypothetical protein